MKQNLNKTKRTAHALARSLAVAMILAGNPSGAASQEAIATGRPEMVAASGSFGTRGGGDLVVINYKMQGLKMILGLKKKGLRTIAGVDLEAMAKALGRAQIIKFGEEIPVPLDHVWRLDLLGRKDFFDEDWQVYPDLQIIKLAREDDRLVREFTGQERWEILHFTLRLMGYADEDRKRSLAILSAAYDHLFPGESFKDESWYAIEQCRPIDKAPVVEWLNSPNRLFKPNFAYPGKKGQWGLCPELKLSDLTGVWLEDASWGGSTLSRLSDASGHLNLSRSPELAKPLIELLRNARGYDGQSNAGPVLASIRPKDPALLQELLSISLSHPVEDSREVAFGVLRKIRPTDPELQRSVSRWILKGDDGTLRRMAELAGKGRMQSPEVAQALLARLSQRAPQGLDDLTVEILRTIGRIKPRDPESLNDLERALSILRAHPANPAQWKEKARNLKIDWLDEKP